MAILLQEEYKGFDFQRVSYLTIDVGADDMCKALSIKRDCLVEFNAEKWTSEVRNPFH